MVVALIICPALTLADIYKYVDNNGVVHFTNAPEDKNNDYEKVISEKKARSKQRYDQIIDNKSEKYNIESSIIKAIITAESDWNAKAVSSKGALGLMQLMPSTARDMNISDPLDPEENIEGGTRYLRYLLDRFSGDINLALAAYNAGPAKVEKTREIPAITETREFVKKVLNIAEMKGFRKPTRIYKVVYDDGTTLYTNTPRPYKNHELSNF
jgi:soluble lytic murein transglycosylase